MLLLRNGNHLRIDEAVLVDAEGQVADVLQLVVVAAVVAEVRVATAQLVEDDLVPSADFEAKKQKCQSRERINKIKERLGMRLTACLVAFRFGIACREVGPDILVGSPAKSARRRDREGLLLGTQKGGQRPTENGWLTKSYVRQ